MNEKQPEQRWGFMGTAFVLAIIAGSLSGIVAAVFTNRSLDTYFQTLSEDVHFFSLSDVKPRPLPGSYEEALDRVQEIALQTTAVVTLATSDTNRVDRWIRNDERLGSGVVITSDGWIVFQSSIFENVDDPVQEVDIWIVNKRYSIEEILYDELTDAAMVRVDARDLVAIAFGSSADMNGGEIVFGNVNEEEIVPTSLANSKLYLEEQVLPAEVFGTSWELSKSFDSSVALFNSSAELIGVADSETVVPMHHMLGFIQATFRGQEQSRPGIGAYAVDIGSVRNIDPELISSLQEGALIIAPNTRTSAIVKGSPAESTGLQPFDVIVSVAGVRIGKGQTVAELISTHKINDTVMIVFVRNGEEQESSITLGAYSEFVYK